MADHTVLGHPRRPYIMLKDEIEKIQLVENRQTENREKTVMLITEATLFPDGSLGTIIQIFKHILAQYTVIHLLYCTIPLPICT